jgi:hypothetical protein
MGLLNKITARDFCLGLVVAAATCYIGYGLTKVPESKPASLERSLEQGRVKYSGKLDNNEGFTFITAEDGSLVNLEERRNSELAEIEGKKRTELNKAKSEYYSTRANLGKKYNDLQKKLRNFGYE